MIGFSQDPCSNSFNMESCKGRETILGTFWRPCWLRMAATDDPDQMFVWRSVSPAVVIADSLVWWILQSGSNTKRVAMCWFSRVHRPFHAVSKWTIADIGLSVDCCCFGADIMCVYLSTDSIIQASGSSLFFIIWKKLKDYENKKPSHLVQDTQEATEIYWAGEHQTELRTSTIF